MLRSTILLLALAIAPLPASAFTTFDIDIDRLSPDPEAATFSGTGSLTVDTSGGGTALTALTLEIETLGQDTANAPTTHMFSFGLGDVTTLTGFTASGGSLGGSIFFNGVPSSTGDVFMSSLLLDFDSPLASGFCFSSGSIGTAQCVEGGGTSTGVEAALSATKVNPVPLPAALGFLLAALGGLAGVGAYRRGRLPSVA